MTPNAPTFVEMVVNSHRNVTTVTTKMVTVVLLNAGYKSTTDVKPMAPATSLCVIIADDKSMAVWRRSVNREIKIRVNSLSSFTLTKHISKR